MIFEILTFPLTPPHTICTHYIQLEHIEINLKPIRSRSATSQTTISWFHTTFDRSRTKCDTIIVSCWQSTFNLQFRRLIVSVSATGDRCFYLFLFFNFIPFLIQKRIVEFQKKQREINLELLNEMFIDWYLTKYMIFLLP